MDLFEDKDGSIFLIINKLVEPGGLGLFVDDMSCKADLDLDMPDVCGEASFCEESRPGVEILDDCDGICFCDNENCTVDSEVLEGKTRVGNFGR